MSEIRPADRVVIVSKRHTWWGERGVLMDGHLPDERWVVELDNGVRSVVCLDELRKVT